MAKKNADEIKPKNKGTKCFFSQKLVIFTAELIGTALLMFIGCMGCINAPTHHLGALAFGLTVLMIIQIFGHISAAHLNPAVTIATLYLGYVKPVMGIVYFVAEFLGAIIGFALLKVLVPPEYVATEVYDPVLNKTIHKTGLCTTMPHEKTTTAQALSIEIIITAALILVCCSVWDKRNASNADSIPVRFGLVITTISIAAGPFTGASMNTARSFAPALLNGDWNGHWIYWLGPTAGGIIGAVLYKFLYSVPDEESKEVQTKSQEPLADVPLTSTNVQEKV